MFRIITFIMCVCFAQIATASKENNTHYDRTRLGQSENKNSMEKPWEDWGLDKEEWARYLKLKKGVRGTWSPDIDPIAMLALEARTDKETRYYSEKYAEMQDKRLQRELLVDRYRREYIMKKYSGKKTFDQKLLNYSNKANIQNSPSLQSLLPGDRILMFTYINVTPSYQIKQIQNFLKSKDNNNNSLDIYLLDTEDNEINKWAKIVNIDPELVKRNRVTLNHEKGELKKLRSDAGRFEMFIKRGNHVMVVNNANAFN